MKVGLPILVIAAVGPLTAAAQTTEEIVEKSIAARGGMQKLKAVQSERVTGRIISGREESRFVVELKRPGKIRMELTQNGKTIMRIYDGQYGWIVNPTGGKAEAVPLTVNEIKNIQKEADFDGPLLDYKVKQTQVELMGKEKINGKSVYKLRVAVKDDDVRYYYFDAASFLLVKWEGTRIENGKQVGVESSFRNYRDVEGLKIAFEILSRTPGTNLKRRLVLEKVELNSPLDDSRFSKPEIAAVPPVFPGAKARAVL
jgi:outer membrane lipoprotein-sorting protein